MTADETFSRQQYVGALKAAWRAAAFASALLAGAAYGQQACPVAGPEWVATWGSAQQIPEPANALAPAQMQDTTLRQIVHLSAGGTAVRIRFSNAFGTTPLLIDSAHLALAVRPDGPALRAGSDRTLTFGGNPEVSIPPGADFVSDAVDVPVPAFSDLAVTLHASTLPAVQTGHPGSRATSYVMHGDAVAAVSPQTFERIEHWYMLSGVEVRGSCSDGVVVALGDSITDGHGATTNGNDRWPDVLALRLSHTPGLDMAVVNTGIGGNHLLTDGLGPNALARFDRDVLARPGVRTVILLEGVNDLGALSLRGDQPAAAHERLTSAIIEAYRQIVRRAHAQGIRVVGGTITPYVGSGYYHPASANEADRELVNAWIRGAGHFDAVVDFDRVVRDPAHPAQMLPAYDSGDHLHPSPAGYAAMAAAVQLDALTAH